MKLFGCLFLFLAMNLQAQTNPPTVAEAREFMNKAEAQLADLTVKVNRATWVQENFITDDTEAMAADAIDQVTAVTTELVEQAKRFEGLPLPPDLARKFLLLKLSLVAPAPRDPVLRKEMTTIGVSLDADYGKGKYCRKNGECLDITAIEKLMATSRDPEELKEVWEGWHTIAPPMRQRYSRFVDLSNQGAREMGFSDVGALWRSGYDMPPDAFSADVERLWNEVKPLYLSLHAFVRAKLVEKYGPASTSLNC
jgi:peptidyl-dipeptidase A